MTAWARGESGLTDKYLLQLYVHVLTSYNSRFLISRSVTKDMRQITLYCVKMYCALNCFITKCRFTYWLPLGAVAVFQFLMLAVITLVVVPAFTWTSHQ